MLAVGTPAPALDSWMGQDRRGPVLLAFFKVSCPTCHLTFPFLDRISKGSLRVIGVSQDSAELTKMFCDRFGVTFDTVFDLAADGYPMSNAFGITNVPSLFLIEEDGNISFAESGFAKVELDRLGKRAGVEVFRGEKVPAFKPG